MIKLVGNNENILSAKTAAIDVGSKFDIINNKCLYVFIGLLGQKEIFAGKITITDKIDEKGYMIGEEVQLLIDTQFELRSFISYLREYVEIRFLNKNEMERIPELRVS